ncbi:MAG: hypothetical protein ABIS06_19255 [Vicinamibacterales bacterium]
MAVVCVAAAGFGPLAAQPFRAAFQTDSPQSDRRRHSRLDEALKREGDALLEMTEHAVARRAVPADFRMQWKNDFFKAKPGTFVPFTLTVDRLLRPSPGALIYVRVMNRSGSESGRRPADPLSYETIFSVEPELLSDEPFRVRRGFAVPPGSYTVYVALRERPADLLARSSGERRAAVLVQDLDVPDFWTDGLATSTVILADRVEQLGESGPSERIEEDPYLVGTSRIHPARDPVFRRGTELIVVFLVYNPSVTPDKHFDVQVDYHLYRKLRQGQGERYVTRTNPQRFTLAMMGPHFDPAGGQPVLAGQGILLSGFEEGDYRLGITVTDLLSRKTVSRDVAFTVVG